MTESDRNAALMSAGALVGVLFGIAISAITCSDHTDMAIKDACGDHCTRGAQCGAFTCTANGIWVR